MVNLKITWDILCVIKTVPGVVGPELCYLFIRYHHYFVISFVLDGVKNSQKYKICFLPSGT